MNRSQREVLIKAGFYEASLANFLAVIDRLGWAVDRGINVCLITRFDLFQILRAAMSFITLIQSIE